jgi:hypothetical protein
MQTTQHAVSAPRALNLRVGDLVEVRSEAEILAILDDNGELDNLPFMPEMIAYCGQRLTVHKVAHKLCDTISGTGLRRMERAVHLTGARCDGSAHGGCQTACQFYWKEAWLKRVDPAGTPSAQLDPDRADGRILLPLLQTNTRREPGSDGETRYSCQATELLRAAPQCLPLRDFRQYADDVRSGNTDVRGVATAFLVSLFNWIQALSMRRLPHWMLFRGGRRWRFLEGRAIGRTPTAEIRLRPGELVRVKSREEILATLDQKLHNRGMGFEEEMERYCGTVARVQSRVDRCIDERTGRMLTMKSPCIILENVTCAGVYNASCPRQFVPFWREIWLERVSSEA